MNGKRRKRNLSAWLAALCTAALCLLSPMPAWADGGSGITLDDNPGVAITNDQGNVLDFFLTLKDAVGQLPTYGNDNIIKLLKDQENLSEQISISVGELSFTLDLNGHRISGTIADDPNEGSQPLIVIIGGNVTVIGSGSISSDNAAAATIYVGNGAKLTVDGAGVEVTATAQEGIGIENYGIFEFCGGAINCLGDNGVGILNGGDLTVSGGTINCSGSENGYGIEHMSGTFNLSGSPVISGPTADIHLKSNTVININNPLTAPMTTGDNPVSDPWTVKSDNIDDSPTEPYIFTSGFSTNCLNGNDVADPAAYFVNNNAGITTRLVDGTIEGSKEAQFMQYAEPSEPTMTEAQHADGYWIGDELTSTTDASPADGITWQWYRKLGDGDPIAIPNATGSGLSTTYTVSTDDYDNETQTGYQIYAVATMAAGAAGTYPATDISVSSPKTTAVVKKDNNNELPEIQIPLDQVGRNYVTIAGASPEVEYLVVEKDAKVTSNYWTRAQSEPEQKITNYVTIDEDGNVVEKNMLPSTYYQLYYRLKETEDTKPGSTSTGNELNIEFTTLDFDRLLTIGDVTYQIYKEADGTAYAEVVALDIKDDEEHPGRKTVNVNGNIILKESFPAEDLEIYEAMGYKIMDFIPVLRFDGNIIDLSVIGSSIESYGYIIVEDFDMLGLTVDHSEPATPEGYQIFGLFLGGYYVLSDGTEYKMADKDDVLTDNMTPVLGNLNTGGEVKFYDYFDQELTPETSGENAGKILFAKGQQVTVTVKLPTNFKFAGGPNENFELQLTDDLDNNNILKSFSLSYSDEQDIWTGVFNMPYANPVTISFVEPEMIQGSEVTFTYYAPDENAATVTADADNPSPVRMKQPLVYTIEPKHTGVNYYTLTDLGLTEGVEATIVDANDESEVSLPTEKKVKVTLTVPPTFTGEEVTFAPNLAVCAEDITIAPNGTITYYDTKGLKYAGDNNGVIFATVTDISGTTVTVTEINTKEIPARTPFFITNTSNAQSIRMEIGNYDAVTVADGFLGTAEGKTTSDQGFGPWNMLEDMKYYGFNGTDFVWIREPGNVAAHRCWIQLATGGTGGALARMLNIDWPDGSATGISTINAGDTDSDNWYDLNGRKLQGKPQKKGLYIRNGQKMVVK